MNIVEKLENILVKKLVERGMKVALAESCTGGLVAERITSVSGASQCFDLGVVSYANEQKEKILGVDKNTLETLGAVSKEVAYQMSAGIKKLSGADFGVGITGLAGPGGATEFKPVGLVYISVCSASEHKAFEYHFTGDRDEVREKSADEALRLVIEML